MDPRLEGQYWLKGAWRAASLALQCLSVEPKYRPTMEQVVAALEQLQDAKDIDRIPKIKDKSISERAKGCSLMPRQTSSKEARDGRVVYPAH